MVLGRVGESLCLEAEPVALPKGSAGWADQGAIQVVARIELKPGRVGQDVETEARSGLECARRRPQSFADRPSQYPIAS